MNEIYSRGTSADPDCVEIYNSSAAAIDISGYKIYDAGGEGGTKAKKILPSGSVIPLKGFLVVITDDTTSSGFGLSNSGEKIWLENSSGVLIDSVTYLAHTAAQSYGRSPDGGDWKLLNTITRGKSNGTTTTIKNEIINVKDFELKQNYPNPFNSSTTIKFSLPVESRVNISVFNILGQRVAELINDARPMGSNEAIFNASNLASGVYIYRINAVGIDGQTKYNGAMKMILMK